MPIEIFKDLEQGTDEWKKIRAGLPTASEFSALLAKGEGKMRAGLLRRLAGERVTGEPEEGFRSSAMERGNVMEEDARRAYSLLTDSPVDRIGFVRNTGAYGAAGYSPDGFVGEDGLVEFKSNKPSVLIGIWERGTCPPEHVAQVQGGLWLTGRQWCDVVCYWPRFPTFICRVHRDPAKIAEIAREVKLFNEELDALVAKIKGWA